MSARRSIIQYDSLNKQMFERFPILTQTAYQDLIAGIQAGPYVTLGVLFNRYILDLARGGTPHAKDEVASFIEDMANAQDQGVTDLLTTEVLPTLLTSQEVLNDYWPLLGAVTRRRLRTMHPRFARKVEFPAAD
jgi:hypothetical protein